MSPKLIDAQTVATLLDEPVRQVRERITRLPTFPKPYRLGGVGHKKWDQGEVLRWLEQQRETV